MKNLGMDVNIHLYNRDYTLYNITHIGYYDNKAEDGVWTKYVLFESDIHNDEIEYEMSDVENFDATLATEIADNMWGTT